MTGWGGAITTRQRKTEGRTTGDPLALADCLDRLATVYGRWPGIERDLSLAALDLRERHGMGIEERRAG